MIKCKIEKIDLEKKEMNGSFFKAKLDCKGEAKDRGEIIRKLRNKNFEVE